MYPVKVKLTTALCLGGGVVLGIWALRKVSTYISDLVLVREMYLEWNGDRSKLPERAKEWPKDTVILHGSPRGSLAPHISCFVMKLETFLRMHDIPYQFDCEFPLSDNGKMPWVTLNGEHYADSQIIINFLKSKFNLKPKGSYSEVDRATGVMARVMLEEHVFWGLIMWRYVYAEGEQLDKMFNMSDQKIKMLQKLSFSNFKQKGWHQGIGRYSQEDVTKLILQDLKNLSVFLSTKSFLLGEEPCDEDCAVFGMLAQFIWNDVTSPYTKVILEEMPNLKEYCLKMKELYYKDWDSLLQTSSGSSVRKDNVRRLVTAAKNAASAAAQAIAVAKAASSSCHDQNAKDALSSCCFSVAVAVPELVSAVKLVLESDSETNRQALATATEEFIKPSDSLASIAEMADNIIGEAGTASSLRECGQKLVAELTGLRTALENIKSDSRKITNANVKS